MKPLLLYSGSKQSYNLCYPWLCPKPQILLNLALCLSLTPSIALSWLCLVWATQPLLLPSPSTFCTCSFKTQNLRVKLKINFPTSPNNFQKSASQNCHQYKTSLKLYHYQPDEPWRPRNPGHPKSGSQEAEAQGPFLSCRESLRIISENHNLS